MQPPFILIDASSWFYRAFHALPPLTNSKGQPTGAIYGVVNMIKKLIKDYRPERIAVIFDAKGKTFRDDLYPEYKSHRPPTPPDLSIQFEPLIAIIHAMGLPTLIIEGVEADDVIGTLAKEAANSGHKVLISTGDKDMAQLVDEHITLFNTMNDSMMDVEGVKTRFGVHPTQIVDYLSLMGDTVDNIPGVDKCGPKTAAKWMQEYHTLDKLIENAHAIGGKIGENLRNSLAFLPLAKQLVTIKTDVPLPLALDDLKPSAPDQKKLLDLVQEMEFKNWLKDLLNNGAQEKTTSVEKATFELITTENQLKTLIDILKKSDLLSFYMTTDSQQPMSAKITGIALALENYSPVYIPLGHKNIESLLPDFVFSALKPILENASIQKISHDIKLGHHILKKQGITLAGMTHDTMLHSYIIDSNATSHGLDDLSLKYLGEQLVSLEEVIGKGVKKIAFDEASISLAASYASCHAASILKLHKTLYAKINDGLRNVLHAIEMPLVSVLAEMEQHGVLIDANELLKQGERLKLQVSNLEKEAFELSGRPFNLNSPKQLQTILFDELKIPVQSKTPTGQASTSESVLQDLAWNYRLPAILLEYRSLTKLISTYIDTLPKRINPETLRVHTSYNQAVAATGRLSSSDPNLQNIPIRTQEGRLIRKAFIAPPGHLLMAADYSQIELRIMAHLSQDPNLLLAFQNNWDIHTATASEIFEIPQDSVTAEHRRRAKAVNFGLIYGMSAFGLSKQLGIERSQAQLYMNTYFERYPAVLEFMEQTRRFAHEHGFVETIFGRRLYLSEINTRNLARQKAAERAAINAPMQGSAADIIKKSMLALAEWQHEHEGMHMIMQVHDELVFEVQENAIDFCREAVRNLMENTVSLDVPLQVSIGTGKNWDEAHA